MIKTTMIAAPVMVAGLAAVTLSACSNPSVAPVPTGTAQPPAEFDPKTSAPPGTSTFVPPPKAKATATATVKPGAAVKEVLTPDVLQAAGDAYYAATRSTVGQGRARDMVISPTHTFYGAIISKNTRKDVFWLMGDTGYKGLPTSQQDGPHVWRKVGRGTIGWAYLGDTGGNPCSKVPMALIKVWDVRDLCPK